MGTHPTISYPNLVDFPDTEIRIRYQLGNRSNKKRASFYADDCPRHFLWLSDRAVKRELGYKMARGKWSERVLLEKTYFTLFYGGTGLASQYMDSVDDFQTDLVGWEIMNRSANHCEWEGVECVEQKLYSNSLHYHNSNSAIIKSENVVVGFQINGFSLEGTLPHDLHHLSHLEKVDLKGNQIQGSIPASWGLLFDLVDLDLGDNRLSGELPSSLKGWTNLQNLKLSSNRLEGGVSQTLIEAWTKREEQNNNNKTVTNTSTKNDVDNDNNNDDENENEKEETTINGLQTLDLSNNRLQGIFHIDTLVQFAKDLVSLDLSHNLFTGGLPETIVVDKEKDKDNTDDENQDSTSSSSLVKLVELNLSKNMFKGNFPKEWTKLPSIKVLNLSHNQLTGSLPTQVWRASSLERLELVRVLHFVLYLVLFILLLVLVLVCAK